VDASQARRRSRAPWIVLAVAAPVLVLTVALSLANGRFQEVFTVFAIGLIVGYGTVGALVASREPSNPIGWIMLVMGLGFLLTGLADEWVAYTYLTDPGSLPLGPVALWINNWGFLLAFGLVPLLVELFPTGRVASPRWRFLPPLTIAVVALLMASLMFRPGPTDHDLVTLDNPAGIEALDGVTALAGRIGGSGLVIVGALAVVSLVLRFRRAGGEERQQIRWFAYAALFVVGSLFAALAVNAIQQGGAYEIFFYVFFAGISIGIPASVGVALLRYRLYDLDLVVKKALVFGILVILLFAVGAFVVIVAATPVFERLYDSPSMVAIVGIAIGLGLPPLYRLAKRIADRLVYGGRANPYEVLAGFTDRVAEAYASDDVLPRMAAILHGAVGATVARVWLHVGRELRPAAAAPGDALPAGVLAAPDGSLPPIPGEAAFEVRHQGDLLGALSVVMPANDPMNPSKERLIRDLASQAGLVLRNVLLIEDLRESRRRIVSAQDERARALERNIHDGAQQQLVALAVQLRLAKTMVERDPAKAAEMFGGLETAASDALEDLRDLARGIYPPLLADKGLAAALEAQARKAAVPVSVEAAGADRYPQDVESAVYFCTLEALNNVAKYAGASQVRVRLERSDGHLTVTIADDGAGFDPVAAAGGTGLQGMADRLAAVGGDLRVQSAPGEGTTITGSVPVTN
jgi:signal transduction histidine kinase